MDSSLRWNDYCIFAVNYEIIDFVNSLSPLCDIENITDLHEYLCQGCPETKNPFFCFGTFPSHPSRPNHFIVEIAGFSSIRYSFIIFFTSWVCLPCICTI